MASWNRYLVKVAHALDSGIDSGRRRLEPLRRRPLLVLPYLSYGQRHRVYLIGRVLADKGLRPAGEADGAWRNLRNAVRRFESDEVAGARVEVTVRDGRTELTTDAEGYYRGWLELEPPLAEAADFVDCRVELKAPLRPSQETVTFAGEILVPPPEARFGIISDLDDTVLQTGATSLLSMARHALLGNSRTRLPFAGVAGFYAALQSGGNPIFYVSSSPWNLYDVLIEFLELNGVPMGPLLLRDWGSSATELLPTSHGPHKRAAIERIFETYPSLPFLLIGDSGQEDPELYAGLVERHPRQILGIYIRDVSGSAVRRAEVARLAESVARHGKPLLLVPDTLAAAQHAAAQGWMAPEDLSKVKVSRAADLRAQ